MPLAMTFVFVSTPEAIPYTLVEEEGSLDLREFSARVAGGAAFGEPRFSRSVVALEEIYGMGVLGRSGRQPSIVMSCATYSSELMLMREGLCCAWVCRRVRACTVAGHSRYHQNLAAGQ